MRRALAAALIVAGTVLGWSTVAADAATVADAGWWDRNANDLVPRLDPPPAGALRVANDPAGPRAIAAVRFQLDEGERDPTLVLRVADDPVPDGAAFVACPATSEWSGAEGAPLSEAPEFDCDAGAALGLVAGDASTVSFDLSQIARDPTVDVVIIPSPTGESPITDTYTVDFAAPTPTDISVGGPPAAAPSVPSGSGSDSGATAPTPGGSPSGGGSPAPGPSGGGGFSGPASPAVTPPADAAPSVTTPAASAPVNTSTDLDQAVAPPVELATSPSKRWVGLLTAALIIALGAYLWRADRARAAMTAGPVLGGLGPFVRERSGPAPDVA